MQIYIVARLHWEVLQIEVKEIFDIFKNYQKQKKKTTILSPKKKKKRICFKVI